MHQFKSKTICILYQLRIRYAPNKSLTVFKSYERPEVFYSYKTTFLEHLSKLWLVLSVTAVDIEDGEIALEVFFRTSHRPW